MRVVYNVTNDAEAGLVDLAASRVRWGGELRVLLVVGDGVKRQRWPRGVDVARVQGVQAGGLPAARQLLTLVTELGEDVIFCSADTVLCDWLAAADAFARAAVWSVCYGGFCEPGHWLWGVRAADARGLLEAVRDMGGAALAGVVHGDAGAEVLAAGLSPAAIVYRVAAARGWQVGQFAAADAGLYVFGAEDFSARELPRAWAVHCGCPEFVRAYPRADVAIRRAMVRVLRSE